MGELVWECAKCGDKLAGNPRHCPACGYTVYKPTWPVSEETSTRCPSKIAHEDGAVRQCQIPAVDHTQRPDLHRAGGEVWSSADHRLLLGSVPTEEPDEAFGEADYLLERQYEKGSDPLGLKAIAEAAYARGVSEGLRQADNAINWQTACLGCADQLDGLYAERARGFEEGVSEGRRRAKEVAFDPAQVGKLTELVHQYFDVDSISLADPLETSIAAVTEAIADHDTDGIRAWTQRQEGVSEGRRQAVEGWEREWAVETSAVTVQPCDDEEDARSWSELAGWGGVVSRLVGPWEPTERPAGPTDDPNDCCDPGTSYHSNPHRGCILR